MSEMWLTATRQLIAVEKKGGPHYHFPHYMNWEVSFFAAHQKQTQWVEQIEIRGQFVFDVMNRGPHGQIRWPLNSATDERQQKQGNI